MSKDAIVKAADLRRALEKTHDDCLVVVRHKPYGVESDPEDWPVLALRLEQRLDGDDLRECRDAWEVAQFVVSAALIGLSPWAAGAVVGFWMFGG